VKLVQAAEARGRKWGDALRLALQAILVSPRFLFRVELDDRPDSAEPHPIDEYQLASRLSYFLWSSLPDDELFALADKKALTRNLEAQVARMLQDPRSKALVDNFAMQWLQLRRLQVFTPDARLFPTFNEPLRKAMLEETALFFQAVLREDRSILDLIDADDLFSDRRKGLSIATRRRGVLGCRVWRGRRARLLPSYRIPPGEPDRGRPDKDFQIFSHFSGGF
jgi:hypothetical protein